MQCRINLIVETGLAMRQPAQKMTQNKLKTFVQEATRALEHPLDPKTATDRIRPLLQNLVNSDDWLDTAFCKPHPQYYQQYLLHCDPLERFSVVSFVWGPGQQTPVHNHTVWGLIGMLRGSEISTPYAMHHGELVPGAPTRLSPGTVETLLPDENDIHLVRNAYDDRVSISIHVYGANIGAVTRHVFNPATGERKEFISGYSAPVAPNIGG
jgi:predicted metal-dependent enzyme (double-stranded beta helix superfamily)